jgi:hypothetical protein
VRVRLQRGESLETITRAALQHCLADNPTSTQGIGADNMTFLVVALKSMSSKFNSQKVEMLEHGVQSLSIDQRHYSEGKL